MAKKKDKQERIKDVLFFGFLFIYPWGLFVHMPPLPGQVINPMNKTIFYCVSIPFFVICLGYLIFMKYSMVIAVGKHQKILARLPFLKEPLVLSIQKKKEILIHGRSLRKYFDALVPEENAKKNETKQKITYVETRLRDPEVIDLFKKIYADKKEYYEKRLNISVEDLQNNRKSLELTWDLELKDIDLHKWTITDIERLGYGNKDFIDFLKNNNINDVKELVDKRFALKKKFTTNLSYLKRKFSNEGLNEKSFEDSVKTLLERIIEDERRENYQISERAYKSFLRYLCLTFKELNPDIHAYHVEFEYNLSFDKDMMKDLDVVYINEEDKEENEERDMIKQGLIITNADWNECFPGYSGEVMYKGWLLPCSDVSDAEMSIPHMLTSDTIVLVTNYCDYNRNVIETHTEIDAALISKIEVEALLYLYNDVLKSKDTDKRKIEVKDAALEKKDIETEDLIQHILDTVSPDQMMSKPNRVQGKGIHVAGIFVGMIGMLILGLILGVFVFG